MAGKLPFFTTGSNAIVRLNGKTMAFCTDVGYSVSVAHALPKVLGMYECISVEPLSYEVSGSFSVIRYMNGVKDLLPEGASPVGVNPGGNGVGEWGPGALRDLILGHDGRAKDALNPATYGASCGFDIEIMQKVSSSIAGVKLTVPVAKLRNCRIVKADFSIGSKTSPAVQRFMFYAMYVDEDSFQADVSGVGQNFA